MIAGYTSVASLLSGYINTIAYQVCAWVARPLQHLTPGPNNLRLNSTLPQQYR